MRVVAVIEFPEQVTLEMARDRLMFVNRGTLGMPDVSAWIRSVEPVEEDD
jgi:hypothetical protein